MGKSIAELNEELKNKYKTKSNTYDMFDVGDEVKVICAGQDFNFFNGETGKIKENKHSYLGLIVQFDEPRHYKGPFDDDYVQRDFNFAPDDLIILKKHKKEDDMLNDINTTTRMSNQILEEVYDLFEALKPLMEEKTGVSARSYQKGIIGQINCNLETSLFYIQLMRKRIGKL